MYCERIHYHLNRKASDGNRCYSDTLCSNKLTVDTMEGAMEGLVVGITVAAMLGLAAKVTERALQRFAADET